MLWLTLLDWLKWFNLSKIKNLLEDRSPGVSHTSCLAAFVPFYLLKDVSVMNSLGREQ